MKRFVVSLYILPIACCLLHAFLGCLLRTTTAAEPVTHVGAGSYLTAPPPGANLPPRQIYAASELRKKMPTNDWWSSLAWLPLSERQYPHPLGVQADEAGLRVFHAGARITANKDGVFGFSPGPGGGDLVIGHSSRPRFETAEVEAFSDWFVTARLQKNGHAIHLSYGHGSPFVFARYESGTPRIIFNEPPKIWSGRADGAVLALSVADRHYALFAPSGSRWEGIGTKELLCRTEKDYFSLALLPDAKQETLRLFHRYAHAHVVDTRVSWSYVPESGEVRTSFAIETEPREGDERGTLTALYPARARRRRA